MNPTPRNWIRSHQWKLLLGGMILLLLISPIPEVYDQQDNVISPLVAIIFIAVILGTAEAKPTIWLLTALTLVWLVISIATKGSGLFAGPSLVAPLLFMVLLMAIFVLLARWLIRVVHINSEVLCAAICGYVLLGVIWTGLYATMVKIRLVLHDSDAFSSVYEPHLQLSDLLYFSFTTLTTTGYGDIIPRGAEVRMLAVMEAMTGLFYHTIVIARFVGLYAIKKME